VRKEFKALAKPFNTSPKEYLKYLNQNTDISLNTNMEILNQLEKRDFQVMKFLLKSVSNASNDQKQNTWKTDLKKYMKYFTKNLKEKKSYNVELEFVEIEELLENVV
jgi:hypothetical protein